MDSDASKLIESAQQTIDSLFNLVAQKDKNQLEILKRDGFFTLDDTCWCFTLPQLYLFFQKDHEVFLHVDYTQFRRLIFNSSINKNIKTHGAEIIIRDNQRKADDSLYALIWKIAD